MRFIVFSPILISAVILPGTVFEYDDEEEISSTAVATTTEEPPTPAVSSPRRTLLNALPPSEPMPITTRLNIKIMQFELKGITEAVASLDSYRLTTGCDYMMKQLRRTVTTPLEALLFRSDQFYAGRLSHAVELCQTLKNGSLLKLELLLALSEMSREY